MSLLINGYQFFAGTRALEAFRTKCQDSGRQQGELLSEILKTNSNTVYGRKCGFGKIGSVGEFRSVVPVATYDDLGSYVKSSMRGEGNQLTVDAPVFYATTSGTTGPIKYIPITRAGHESRSRLMKLWHFALMRDHPRVYRDGMLAVISPATESFTPAGVPCGAESGRNYRNKPAFIRRKYAIPYETFMVPNFEAKYYCIARMAACKKVTYIYTCNPSTILLLSKSLGDNTERIVRDIRDGRLSHDVECGAAFRAAVAPQLRSDPARARFLESAAAQAGGVLLPRHVWPELELIACWKGGSLGQYLDRFGQYFSPQTSIRDIGYFASEFFGSIPMSDEGSDGVLDIGSNFYEFFPADSDREPAGHELLGADGLEQGKRYFIYVTTQSGLYRYDMNDIVEVCGFFGNTPLVRFVQKRKGITSLTGEKLSESQVMAAVDSALASRKGRCDFIAAVGELSGDVARYSFLIEFDESPHDWECREVLAAIDREVRARNTEYDAKRRSGRIAHAALKVVRKGEFTRYRKRKVEAGKSDSVFKTLRLTTDSRFADEFITERLVFASPPSPLRMDTLRAQA